jgi:peptidoglycan hydrolase-like protein with peptidoglycan-binding domain
MLRKFVFIAAVFIIGAYLTGCGKKQESLEQMQEPMSMEALSTLKADKTAGQTQAPEAQMPPASQQAPQLAQLPPAGPYKPSIVEIQTALKNAGYYAGTVDGKIGPKTKDAIQEFQKANGLTADGKVGPKTWSLLSTHLNPSTTTGASRR